MCTASHCHIFSSPLLLLEFILHAMLIHACVSYKSLILFTCWVLAELETEGAREETMERNN
jgi:hypothetical protein